MKINKILFAPLCAMFLILFVLGCSQKAGQVQSTEAIAANVDKSFANASSDATTLAKDGVDSLKNNDLPSAFEHFKNLSERGDLTPSQRQAASAAFVNVLQQARTAADKGDPQAQALLKSYMESK